MVETQQNTSEPTRKRGTEVKIMGALVSQYILVPLRDGTKVTGPHGDLAGNVAKRHTWGIWRYSKGKVAILGRDISSHPVTCDASDNQLLV